MDDKKNTYLKILVTAVAIIVLALRYVYPNLVIDGITIGLILLALIPWLAPIIKSIEIFGIGKVELQDLKDEVEKIKGAVESVEQKAEFASAPSSEMRISELGIKSPDELNVELKALAQKYVQTRKNLRPSPERNTVMTKIFKEMVQISSQMGSFDVDKNILSYDHGDRLSASAYLYANPNREKLDLALESIMEESKPFNQYWGIRAIGKIVYQLSPEEINMKLVNKLEKLEAVLKPNSDRYYELNKILIWVRTRLTYTNEDVFS